MRSTMPRQLCCAAALVCCLALPAAAAPPKPALVRDVDRPASANVDLACTATGASGCTVAAIPAGKRFVTSYVSYVVNFPSGSIAAAGLCSSAIVLDCTGARVAFLPVATPAPFAGLLVATGTPITMVFESGEAPVFVVITSTLPSTLTMHMLGHYEDL